MFVKVRVRSTIVFLPSDSEIKRIDRCGGLEINDGGEGDVDRDDVGDNGGESGGEKVCW